MKKRSLLYKYYERISELEIQFVTIKVMLFKY